jgi:uncharacterized protein YecE (DUF72 family)
MGRIRIGNSGWSYKDWVGTFYPKGTKTSRYLVEYFNHFDTVEINSTFYRSPKKETAEKWGKEASRIGHREYCVKVPQTISHVLCMEDDPLKMISAYTDFSENVLQPLDEHGVLGAVLFQASPYFTVRGDIKYRMKSEPKVPRPHYSMGMTKLKEVCKMMMEHPGDRALELRNSSWLNEDSKIIGGAVDVLRETGTALVTVDGPSFPWIDIETSRHNYIRFHGRNKEGWFKQISDDPSSRYRYDYPLKELEERVDPIKIMAKKVDKETRIFFNNHPQGYAPQNASKMMELLEIERPVGAIDRFW